LNPKCDEPLSNFAFNFKSRHYTLAAATHATRAGSTICGVGVARAGGLGVDPRLAAATLRAVAGGSF